MTKQTGSARRIPWTIFGKQKLAWCPHCKRRHRVKQTIGAKNVFCPTVRLYIRIQERP